MKESPLFTKSYDFVAWLIPLTLKYPRQQRFVLGERLQAAALDFMECLYLAADKSVQTEYLSRADGKLRHVRFNLRLSFDLKLMDIRGFEHASRSVEEIGRNSYNAGLFDLRNSLGHFQVEVKANPDKTKNYLISDDYQFIVPTLRVGMHPRPLPRSETPLRYHHRSISIKPVSPA